MRCGRVWRRSLAEERSHRIELRLELAQERRDARAVESQLLQSEGVGMVLRGLDRDAGGLHISIRRAHDPAQSHFAARAGLGELVVIADGNLDGLREIPMLERLRGKVRVV